MSFNYTTLITDRTQSDVARAKALAAKGWAGMTAEERAEYLTDLKGAYNASDMNRVGACLEDLVSRFHTLGYRVPNYARVKIQRSTSRLPDGYTEVEYIESSGTQYIDTGYAPQSEKVTYEYSWVETVLGTNCSLFGSTNTDYSANSNRWPGTHYKPSATTMYSATGITDGLARISNITAGQVNVGLTVINSGTITRTQNGEMSTATYSGTIQNGIHIGLFADIRTGDVIEKCSNTRLYYWRMKDDGILVRDYIPCINASGVVGLYDLVNEAFYANAGTGTFTAGDAVEWEETEDDADLDPYTWYDTDAPTESEAAQYMANVAAVRSVLAVMSTTPTVPESMARLSVGKANDIEQILLDIFTQLNILKTTLIPCGEAICGGDNL